MPLEFFTNGPLRTLLRVGGIDLVYRRGEDTFPVRLMPADQSQAAGSKEGLVREWSERDWIGMRADLVLEGELIQPEPGDEILVDLVEGQPGEWWQVSAMSTNGQCWEPLAANRDGFRVHTVRIA